MNNLRKIGLSALAGSLAAFSVNAAEVSVSGGASISFDDPNRGGGEVRPLGVDFADPVDVVEEVKPKTKNIPTMNYTVVKGDSLWKISRDYKTTVATLSELNGISGSLIREGQVILVPSANAPEKVVEEPVAEPEEPILEEPTPDPVDSAVEEKEVKEEIPIIPAPINEDDLLPVPEAP